MPNAFCDLHSHKALIFSAAPSWARAEDRHVKLPAPRVMFLSVTTFWYSGECRALAETLFRSALVEREIAPPLRHSATGPPAKNPFRDAESREPRNVMVS